MEHDTPIEQELKLPVVELTPVRQRLHDLGAEPLTPRQRELSILLDDTRHTLRGSGRTLRVREVGERCLLTFKGPLHWHGAVKEREELETEVAGAPTILAILAQLGFVPTFRYEKHRERWQLGTVEVDLDELPIGTFVELEGPRDDLHEAARLLQLDPVSAVRGSYASLWVDRRRGDPSLPRDMVFAS